MIACVSRGEVIEGCSCGTLGAGFLEETTSGIFWDLPIPPTVLHLLSSLKKI